MLILFIVIFQLVAIFLRLSTEKRGVKDLSLPDVAYRISTHHRHMPKHAPLLHLFFSFPVIFHASYLPLTAQ